MIGVEATQIASADEVIHLPGYLLEGRAVCYVCIIDTMDSRCLLGNMNGGIDTHHLGFLIAVGEHFQKAYFDDSVVDDIDTCGFEIKENYGSVKF